jgi:hypothetical protein
MRDHGAVIEVDHLSMRPGYDRRDSVPKRLLHDRFGELLVASGFKTNPRRSEEGQRTFVCRGERHPHLSASQRAMGRHEHDRVGIEQGCLLSHHAHGPHGDISLSQARAPDLRYDVYASLREPATCRPQRGHRPSVSLFPPSLKP